MKFIFGSGRKGRGACAPREPNTFARVVGESPRTLSQGTPTRDTSRRGDRSSSVRNGHFASTPSGSSLRGCARSESACKTTRGKRAPIGSDARVTNALVLFWKEPACFGQWTPSPFTIDDMEYCNAEQWMMASKARLFDDQETLLQIMNTDDPHEHKRLGRLVKNFDADVWESAGYDLVVQGNLAKFRQNPTFQQQLLATGDKILAEASPFDMKWGIGLQADHPDALDQRKWPGRNELGEALMDVRARLKEDIYNQHQLAAEAYGTSTAARGNSMGVDEDEAGDDRL